MFRESHSFVHGRVLGHVCEEGQLKSTEVQHIPHASFDGVRWEFDERLQQGVERALAAEDAEDQLRDESAIERREREPGDGLVDQFSGETLA